MKTFIEFLNQDIKLTESERKTVKEIIYLFENKNESTLFNIKNKLIGYFKKGLLTGAVLLSLLSAPIFTNAENSNYLVTTYNTLMEKEKGKTVDERIQEMKNTKDTDTNYYSYGEGSSNDQSMAQKKAISNVKRNLLTRLGMQQATLYRTQQVQVEVTMTKDGTYNVYVLISIAKTDVVPATPAP